MTEILKMLSALSKWIILLPFRLFIAILNIIPTCAKTYSAVQQTQFGKITHSYPVECTNPIHLGHFIVAWVRGLYGKTSLVELKTVTENDPYEGDSTNLVPVREYSRRVLYLEELKEIRNDCKIW